MLRSTALAAALVALTSAASLVVKDKVPGHVPVIPDAFYAEIHANTTGNLSGVPTGLSVIKQWYDYSNQRLRNDFSDGTTKMYDYKTLVDPGLEKNPKFPAPQGFKFRTDDIENTCCWLWLIDPNTQQNEEMEQFSVESNAKDAGATPQGEHWVSVKKFPFLQTDDWWFKNGTIAIQNTYINIPGHTSVSGYLMSNGTFDNVKYGPIDDSVFAHPDSRPTFGKCKQCGVDSECPMQQCMS